MSIIYMKQLSNPRTHKLSTVQKLLLARLYGRDEQRASRDEMKAWGFIATTIASLYKRRLLNHAENYRGYQLSRDERVQALARGCHQHFNSPATTGRGN